MASVLCFLGMGNMGKVPSPLPIADQQFKAISGNLAIKGDLDKPIILWNRSLDKAHAHSQAVENTVVAYSLEAAVRDSDMIWSSLGDDQAVMATFNSILENDVKGKLFVECSTVTPEYSNELAAKVIGAGAEFVSMPVFGEPSMAAAGLLTCVPAGKIESVEKVMPYLIGVIGRAVIDYGGQETGKASLLKIIGNTFIISMIESLAEGHVLAEKTGLGAANLEKFLEVVFPGPFMIHSKRMSTGAYYKTEPIVNVGMAKHVAGHVLDMAKASGTQLPAYEVARKNMDVIEEQAGKSGDLDGLYGVIRLASGLSYEQS